MKRLINPIAGDTYTAAQHDALQDAVEGARASDSNNDLSALGAGGDTIRWQNATTWSTGKVRKIDTSIDWRDRVVRVWAADLGADAARIGQAGDAVDWNGGGIAGQVRLFGYLGTGAYADLIGTPVSDGNPPVVGAGAPSSYRLTLSVGLYLYADPSTGALYLFNDTGSAVTLYLEVQGSGVTGKH